MTAKGRWPYCAACPCATGPSPGADGAGRRRRRRGPRLCAEACQRLNLRNHTKYSRGGETTSGRSINSGRGGKRREGFGACWWRSRRGIIRIGPACNDNNINITLPSAQHVFYDSLTHPAVGFPRPVDPARPTHPWLARGEDPLLWDEDSVLDDRVLQETSLEGVLRHLWRRERSSGGALQIR